MVVASEEDPRQQGELESLADGGQAGEKVLPILVVEEQVPRVASVGGDVVNPFVQFSRRPSHDNESRAERLE